MTCKKLPHDGDYKSGYWITKRGAQQSFTNNLLSYTQILIGQHTPGF